MLNKITIVFPYYENPGMLVKQTEIINAYPDWVRDNLELIVVDDSSPLGLRAEEAITNFGLSFINYKFQLYRILTNLRWNWLQARNMGAKFAEHQWLLLTDIDHIIPSETIEYIVKKELETKLIYIFPRTDYPDNTPYKPHPNSYLMTKEMFWKVGGYDETLAGNYGSDGEWRRRCEDVAKRIMLKHPIIRVDRKHIPDASTTTLERKENRDPNALDEIRQYKHTHGIGIQTLKLPWKKII